MTGGGGGRGHFSSSFRAGAGRWLGWVGGSPRWPHLRLLVSPPLPPFPQEKGRREGEERGIPRRDFSSRGRVIGGGRETRKFLRGDPPSPFFRRRRPAARDGNLGERGGRKSKRPFNDLYPADGAVSILLRPPRPTIATIGGRSRASDEATNKKLVGTGVGRSGDDDGFGGKQ